jgi:hypothetical protein
MPRSTKGLLKQQIATQTQAWRLPALNCYLGRSAAALFILATTQYGMAPGQEPEDYKHRVLNEWAARSAQIHTVSCSALVETFYPQACLSGQPHEPHHAGAVIPESDKRYHDEPYSWWIDYDSASVKKEYRVSNPFFYGDGSCELAEDFGLHLYRRGKYRFFRPAAKYPERSRAGGALTPDVMLYEGASHQFLLAISDLPLLWLAGGINGDFPLPERLRQIEPVGGFVFRGKAQWNGHDCAVLTTHEQQIATAVREFWVGLEPPYPIYCCRARDGDRAFWQLDVEYAADSSNSIPSRWSCTEYSSPGTLYFVRTFAVNKIDINAPLRPDVFEKALEPGMVAFSVERNRALGVAPDGKLLPLRTLKIRADRSRFLGRLVLSVAAAAALVGTYLFARRYRWKQHVEAGR